jgi:tetratricopeptide (TPR) repeat protein
MLDDYQGALEDLNKVDVLEPNNASTLTDRGDVKRMLKVYQGALVDLDKANVLEPNNACTLRYCGDVKRMLKEYQGALEDLDKADVLEPNNASTLRNRGIVKYMLKEYQGALEDLDKADVLQPNNASTLTNRGDVKYMLDDYQGALEIMDKVHHLQPNDHLIFQTQKCFKWTLNEYQPIIKLLPFNPSIKCFTYNELNFGRSLGKRAYGEVYQSCWNNTNIAIKVLKWSGSHNEGAKKSFISEVRTLGSIEHINLVRLLGYCIKGSKHMLVYEYMSNSSLDTWLNEDNFLDWDRRRCIIIGVAQGLAHLHKCNPIIVHLDIKPQNILLDKDYTPKLADFGLAKILDGKDENVVRAPPFFFLLVMCMHIIS